MGKIVKRHEYVAPIVRGYVGGEGTYREDSEVRVKILVASLSIGVAGFVGWILYASGFNPYNLAVPDISISFDQAGQQRLILYGVAGGIGALIIAGIYHRIRRSI